ncbi:MAG: 5-formyltetrahydrofolate cyclo-ligase [Clostridia bacterium]
MDMKARKQALRQEILARRKALTEGERQQFSSQAAEHLAKLGVLAQCRTVMAFFPFRDEIDTRPFLAMALKRGQQIWLPYTDQQNKRIVPFVFTDENSLKQGAYGICEPDPDTAEPADAGALDAVIMPGSAFDRQGGRMGYGEGYYDRFLASLSHRPILIGLSFEVQLVDELPMEPHDFRVQYVTTESGVSATFPPQF